MNLLDEDVDTNLEPNKPKLPKQQTIQHLTSSFNASNFTVTSGGEVPNPAEMSEKDWHAVTRINSILNGHRFAFAQSFKKPTSSDNNPGNAQVEEGTLIFRRIERAPYTAFEIVPRQFALHEVSNDVTNPPDDDEGDSAPQVFLRIPRFIVTDDSYVNVFETKSAVENSMAQSSFSQTEIKAGAGGGAFGFSAAVSAGFSQKEEAALATQSSTEEESMNITYNFPRVVVHFDGRGIRLTPECAKDLDDVISSQKTSMLLDFHQRYGHFFATRVELGGKLYSSENYKMMGFSGKEEASQAMKKSAKAAFSTSHASGHFKASSESQAASTGENSQKDLSSAINWQAQGGNTLLCNNPVEWVPTVAPFLSWRVIKQEDVVPLAHLIGQIPGREYVPEQFAQIPHRDRKITKINTQFLVYHHGARAEQPVGIGKEGTGPNDTRYIRTGYKDFINAESTGPLDVRGASEQDNAASKLTTMCRQAGLEPSYMQVGGGEASDFQLEVDTYVDGMPRVLYNNWYKLYSPSLEKYVATFQQAGPPKYTIFALGAEEQASYFQFIKKGKSVDLPERERVIEDGTSCEINVISANKDNLGKLSLPVKDHKTILTTGNVWGTFKKRLRPCMCTLKLHHK